VITNIIIGWLLFGLLLNTIETAWYKYKHPEYLPKSLWHGLHMLAMFLLMIPFWPFTIVSILCDDDY
jgi:hypothetical protein